MTFIKGLKKEDTEREVKLGKFILVQRGFADKFWIYQNTGEGIGLNEKELKELEKVISDFYVKNF
jgi:hypothetical protein